MVRSRSTDVDLSLKSSGRLKWRTTHLPQKQRKFGYVLVTTAVAKDGELRHSDAEEAFLETSVSEDVYI